MWEQGYVGHRVQTGIRKADGILGYTSLETRKCGTHLVVSLLLFVQPGSCWSFKGQSGWSYWLTWEEEHSLRAAPSDLGQGCTLRIHSEASGWAACNPEPPTLPDELLSGAGTEINSSSRQVGPWAWAMCGSWYDLNAQRYLICYKPFRRAAVPGAWVRGDERPSITKD